MMMLRFSAIVVAYMVFGLLPSAVRADAPGLSDLVSRAQRGEATAEYELGQRYRGGRGVQQSYVDAAKWYREAADQGYAPAEARLGGMYLAGYGGLPKDEKEARTWLDKAAIQGDSSAKLEVALYDNAFMRWERTLPSALRDGLLFAALGSVLLLLVGVVVAIAVLSGKVMKSRARS